MTGAHIRRTPLSYPALAPLWEGRIERVDDPTRADIHVFAHVPDVAEAARALIEDWRARATPVVVLSEEPFWDTIWGRQPLRRTRVLETRLGPLPVVQLNHHTSSIFDFDHIPYYLLSDHRFANAYGTRFHRNAQADPADWQARFGAREVDLTFMFERRPEPFHNMTWEAGDIIGLCAWRTDLALACQQARGHRHVELLGQSWQGGPSRFDITNWHLDKLTRLDGRARMIGAFENTHQPNYLSEKLFDAFACGAWPLYFASPAHHVHHLGLPEGSWVNLFGYSPQEGAEKIAALRFDGDMFKAYADAQTSLARRFGDPGLWVDERARLARTLHDELQQVLEEPAHA